MAGGDPEAKTVQFLEFSQWKIPCIGYPPASDCMQTSILLKFIPEPAFMGLSD